jgi:hypothetical protein
MPRAARSVQVSIAASPERYWHPRHGPAATWGLQFPVWALATPVVAGYVGLIRKPSNKRPFPSKPADNLRYE